MPEIAVVALPWYVAETERVDATIKFRVVGDMFKEFTEMLFAVEVHTIIMRQHEASVKEMENLSKQLKFLSTIPFAPRTAQEDLESVTQSIQAVKTVLAEMEEEKTSMMSKLDEKAARIVSVVSSVSEGITNPFYVAQFENLKQQLMTRRMSCLIEEMDMI